LKIIVSPRKVCKVSVSWRQKHFKHAIHSDGIATYHSQEEGHRLSVFENRVLRRIFGPKRDEVTEEWRRLHNEELHNLYSSPDIIRRIK
jgi:hypothetical protein